MAPRFPKLLKLVATDEFKNGAHPPDEAQNEKNAKKQAKALLRGMPSKLESLAKQLRETVEAVDNGEVEIEDFAWESELEPKHRGGR
jgi:hypothetical protein